jgi:hypothetical protein
VTDRCNLDCAYCTEYGNSRPHPSLDDLKKMDTGNCRARQARALDVISFFKLAGCSSSDGRKQPLSIPRVFISATWFKRAFFAEGWFKAM